MCARSRADVALAVGRRPGGGDGRRRRRDRRRGLDRPRRRGAARPPRDHARPQASGARRPQATPPWRPTCSTPAGRRTRSTRWPRRRAWACRPPPTRRPPRSCARAAAVRRLHPRAAERLAEREMTALYEQIELPLVPVLGAMEAVGIRVDTYRLAEIAAKLADQVEELEARCHELAGGPFVIGSPKQLGEVLFERLGLPSDRRGKTGYSTDARVLAEDPPPAPDRRRRRAVARAVEAAEHVPRPAARPDRPGRRAPAHDVQPDDRRHRPALVDPPEPAEHPHPHAARARDPKRVRRRRRLQAALGRLLAGRAAHPHPPVGRARAARGLRARRGHPPRHRRPGARQARRPSSPGTSATRRRRSTSASSTASARSASPSSCRSRARRRRASSTPTWPASRA